MPSRSERKLWRSLRRRKGREATGSFLAEGPKLLGEALRAGGRIEAVLHTSGAEEDAETASLLARARAGGHRVEAVPPHVIEEVADVQTPQPVLGVVGIPDWGWPSVGAGSVVLLDGVQDPGNVGALLRTAAALGAAGVVGLEGTVDPWSPKAVRASAGAGLRCPVFRAETRAALAELRARGLPVWGADAGGEPLGRRGRPDGSVALVLGSESHGLSPAVLAAAERRVAIAMRGDAESLNVAAAGAILLDRMLAPAD